MMVAHLCSFSVYLSISVRQLAAHQPLINRI
jgi:hypothetical protein